METTRGATETPGDSNARRPRHEILGAAPFKRLSLPNQAELHPRACPPRPPWGAGSLWLSFPGVSPFWSSGAAPRRAGPRAQPKSQHRRGLIVGVFSVPWPKQSKAQDFAARSCPIGLLFGPGTDGIKGQGRCPRRSPVRTSGDLIEPFRRAGIAS